MPRRGRNDDKKKLVSVSELPVSSYQQKQKYCLETNAPLYEKIFLNLMVL
jgi:hypothetical protein